MDPDRPLPDNIVLLRAIAAAAAAA